MAEENGRISVSEDKLYRALAETKEEIIERVTNIVNPIEARVRTLELTNATEAALAQQSTTMADRRAMVRPTLVATLLSAGISVFLHFF